MNQYLPVVFVVLVLRDAAVVHDVEESGEANGHLNEWSNSTVLGKTVLVVPAPVSPDDESKYFSSLIDIDDQLYLDRARP